MLAFNWVIGSSTVRSSRVLPPGETIQIEILAHESKSKEKELRTPNLMPPNCKCKTGLERGRWEGGLVLQLVGVAALMNWRLSRRNRTPAWQSRKVFETRDWTTSYQLPMQTLFPFLHLVSHGMWQLLLLLQVATKNYSSTIYLYSMHAHCMGRESEK